MKFKESEEQPVVEVSIEAQEEKCPVKEAKDSIIKTYKKIINDRLELIDESINVVPTNLQFMNSTLLISLSLNSLLDKSHESNITSIKSTLFNSILKKSMFLKIQLSKVTSLITIFSSGSVSIITLLNELLSASLKLESLQFMVLGLFNFK